MKTFSLFIFSLLSVSAFSQTITIDGNPGDWPAVLNSSTIQTKAFKHDMNNTNDDQFTQGSHDPDPISNWAWSLGNTNNKGDITNAGAALIGNNLYFFGDRTAINGSAQIGFWFFLGGVGPIPEGANSGTFSGQHVDGDILVLSNFTNGGGVANLEIYRWAGGPNGGLVLLGTTTNAMVNSSPVAVPTTVTNWVYTGTGTTPLTNYPTGAFFEGFVDLGTITGVNPCFTSFLLETRNSPSINASLQDFVGGAFNVRPVVSINDQTVCTGGTATFTATVVGGVTPITFSFNGGVFGASNTFTITNATTSQIVTVVAKGNNGCLSAPDTGHLTVNPLPTCTITGGKDSICAGATTEWCATAGMATYAWTGPGAFTASTQCIMISTAGTYSVTITDSKGCSSSCSRTLTVNQPPLASPASLQVCEAAPGTLRGTFNLLGLINAITGGAQGVTVDFFFDAALLNLINSNLHAAFDTSSITIFARVRNNVTGCLSSAPVTLTVIARPACSITGTNGPVCPGSSNEHCAPAGFKYVWAISGNGTIVGAPGTLDDQCVTVLAGSLCDSSYTVSLIIAAISDTNNCTSTCTKTVNVNDTTPPVITCVASDTLECPATSSFTAPTVTDNCDPSPTVTFVDVTTSASCPHTVTRTWTATDACGNSSTCSQSITINDTTPPVITCAANDTLECPATPVFTAPTVSDACDATPTVTFTDVTTPGSCPQEFTITRTWMATDDCGNSSTCSQSITVEDNTPPVITCAASDTIECPATPVFTAPTVSDACDATPTVTFTDVTTPGSCPQEFTVTRTWTATDDCGNSSTCSQSIKVEDNTPPVITCAAAATIECPATPTFTAPTVSDACDATPTVTFTDVTTPGTCPQEFTVARTWTATDDCGNSSTCSQVITVVDNTPPVVTCSPNITVGECHNVVTFTSSATDNCDTSVAVVCTPASGSTFPVGTTTVTCTATDDCGNTTACSFTVTVVAKPVCTLTAPATPASCSSGGNTISGTVSGAGPFTCSAVFDAAGVSAGWTVTSCAVVGNAITVTYTAGSGVSTVLTVTVTDKFGCTSTCSVTLTCQGGRSCTLGFWKNHAELWDNLGDPIVAAMPAGLRFISTTNFWTYFNLAPGTCGLPTNLTMLGALNQGGGNCNLLVRQGVAALLNVAAFGSQAPLPTGVTSFTGLYNAIRNALLTCNCQSLGEQLGANNERFDAFCNAARPLVTTKLVAPTTALRTGIKTTGDETEELTVKAYPNPFSERLNFRIVSPVSGRALLEIYNALGQKVATVFDGTIDAHIIKDVQYKAPANIKAAALLYKLSVGNKLVTGKVFSTR